MPNNEGSLSADETSWFKTTAGELLESDTLTLEQLIEVLDKDEPRVRRYLSASGYVPRSAYDALRAFLEEADVDIAGYIGPEGEEAEEHEEVGGELIEYATAAHESITEAISLLRKTARAAKAAAERLEGAVTEEADEADEAA